MNYCKTLLAIIALAMATTTATAANFNFKTTTVSRTWETSAEGKQFVPEDVKAGIEATIDMPTGKDALSLAVRAWISSSLGLDGAVYTDADKLIDSYLAQDRAEGEKSMDFNDEMTIKMVYETDKIVSYEMSGYEYPFGTAHGMPYCHGVTFDKKQARM